MTIVADDGSDSHAGGRAEAAVERALAAAVGDASWIGDLLDELCHGRLWLPLPDDGRAVTDGRLVRLPTVRYLGTEFVPGFTSAAMLRAAARTPAAPPPRVRQPPPVQPHIVVPAAALARLLPAGVGIALNPGAGQSVPVYPECVAYLAAAPGAGPRSRVSVGPLPVTPDDLLAGIRAGMADVPAVIEAAAAWLSVELAGEGLVISVLLDDPRDGDAQCAVIQAVERAALAAPEDAWFPIDVTFPGESAPDPVDEWTSACANPFYVRTLGVS